MKRSNCGGLRKGPKAGAGAPHHLGRSFPSPHTLNGSAQTHLRTSLSCSEHHQTTASAVCPPGLGCLYRPHGAAWCQGWWADPGCHGDYSWSQNAIPENVCRGPLQPLWGRRPFIRRKTSRDKLNFGARHPGVRSATCGSLAV